MAQSFIGLDIGSSSIKAALIDGESNTCLASAQSPGNQTPSNELVIDAPQSGFAEQDPQVWWEHVRLALASLKAQAPKSYAQTKAIGISYQMHGLVLLDENGAPVRPAIIWCDSRASEHGKRAFVGLGEKYCLSELLNSPGNFTAAKCAWVKEHEPEIFSKAKTLMLPGDYIAYRLSAERSTTFTGLSEGILWNFPYSRPAFEVLDFYKIPRSFIPTVLPSFQSELRISSACAQELELPTDVFLSYRAGDQPNNALSLGVLNPGDIAATAGTSGVVYGVGDKAAVDPEGRVNSFLHVNAEKGMLRLGTLLCVNGCGILYRWIRENLNPGKSYDDLNTLAAKSSPGACGLVCLPYGNGAERSLGNRFPGAAFLGLDLNRHNFADLVRASLEGIAYSFAYGIEAMKSSGVTPKTIRAGDANLFKSPVFCEVLSTLCEAEIDILATDGAQGAARGAAIGVGDMPCESTSFTSVGLARKVKPNQSFRLNYEAAYEKWREELDKQLKSSEEKKREFSCAA